MLGLGMLMIVSAMVSLWLLYRGKLWQASGWLKWLKMMIPSGFIATLAGWYVAEVGRQPWVVYNAIRTSDVHSAVSSEKVLLSLILFVCCYSLLFWAYVHFIKKTIKKGARLELQSVPESAPQSMPKPVIGEESHHV
jgi:cytochrome d ubiquinol oxidase subunit I